MVGFRIDKNLHYRSGGARHDLYVDLSSPVS